MKLISINISSKRKSLLFAVFLITVLALDIVLACLPVCYAVSVNGENVIYAASMEEADRAVKEAAAQASAILGDEAAIADEVRISANIGSTETAEDDITETILQNLEGVVKRYAVLVNGQAVGASDDEETLDKILNGILEQYSTENTANAAFSENVSIENIFVAENLMDDPDGISDLLSPENIFSPYHLTVCTTNYVEEKNPLPFATEIQYDDKRFDYSEETITEGIEGQETVTYIEKTVNGIVTEKKEFTRICDREPVNEVIVKGTREGYSTGSFSWPTDGTVTSRFGYRSVSVGSSNHKGIDIAGKYGQAVKAADGGVVEYAARYGGYGNFVCIRHDNGDTTCYGHLSEILVNEGDVVAQGDTIAKMGNTGVSTGTHLHFEIRQGGETQVNPLNYLP